LFKSLTPVVTLKVEGGMTSTLPRRFCGEAGKTGREKRGEDPGFRRTTATSGGR